MNSRTTTGALALVAVLVSLLATGLATAPAPGFADTTGVSITWPEVATFESDTTEYVIDVQGATADDLYVAFRATNSTTVSVQQLSGPGEHVVGFPVVQGTIEGHLELRTCPAGSWGHNCQLVGESPLLTVTRVAPPPELGQMPSVTWPAARALNPDLDSYAPQIAWDGTGSLFLEGYKDYDRPWFPVQITQPGLFDITFPADPDAEWHFQIYQCPGLVAEFDGVCRNISASPYVDVWRSMHLQVSVGRRLGPDAHVGMGFSPSAVPTADVHWEILDGATVMTQGVVDDVPTDTYLPPMGPQPMLVDGHEYEYRATVVSDTDAFGHLEGTASARFVWDSTVDAEMGIAHRTFYPVRDKYRDWLVVRLRATKGKDEALDSATLTITNDAGTPVKSLTFENPSDGDDRVYWDGRESGDPVPEGRYGLELTVTDRSGNTRVLSDDAIVDHAHVRVAVWRHNVTPQSSLIDRGVGRCGRLRTPARPGWHGSLGLSVRECSQSDESYVSTVHGVYLPDLPTNPTRHHGFIDVRLRALGGHGRHAPASSLRYYYLEGGHDWRGGDRFGPTLSWHDGWTGDRDYALISADEPHPYFIWTVGFGGPGAYDIRQFQVVTHYWEFR